MSYKSVKEIAKKWKITPTRVTVLCSEGRVTGAYKERNRWMIPADARKPVDLRKTRRRNNHAKFHFIDLFAGIGGFHQAMRFLGGECVMAAEINQACRDTYKLNFKTLEGDIRGDVNEIDPETIAPFDVLCAGFPCQPFSKAGLQQGFKDKTRGNLFYSIMNILDYHPECEFVVLENVRNLADKTENWEVISSELLKRDFIITKEPLILSPSDFGIPQIRERVYILGLKTNRCSEKIADKGYIDIKDLNFEVQKRNCKIGDALKVLEDEVAEEYLISEEQNLMIEAWDELRIATGIKTIGFPLWISCFGVGISDSNEMKQKIGYDNMPGWKKRYVDKNRDFYLKNREFIDYWIKKYGMLNRIKLYQKFEWNCGEDVKRMRDGIIQIMKTRSTEKKLSTPFP